MEDAIRAFVTFLRVERGASSDTIRSYHSDLRQFRAYLRQSFDPHAAAPGPAEVDAFAIRGFLTWLDRRGER
ncbi:MAG: site-specific integrase, partial [Nitrospirales bacterium]